MFDLSREPLAASPLSAEQKERLTELLDRYLSSLECGAPMDADALVEAHPDLAEPLRAYIASLDELHCAAAGFVCDEPGETSPDEAPGAAAGDTRRLGDFVLGRVVGRGGMGVVYEARQISLDRRVAVKVLPLAAVLDARQIARFKNEAHAAAQILHPNIVPVFSVGIDRGVHYYAMQYIDGQPLDQAIAELRESRAARGKPPVQSLLRSSSHSGSAEYFRVVAGLGIQAAEALHAAHEYGIVHRDVKPSNLLLDAAGKLWVSDFGLARCQRGDALSQTGDVVGTRRYMSPEQAAGQSSLVDQRTDIYSLGATLYELLTFEPAAPDADEPRLAGRSHRRPPHRLRPQIPADLENVVLKAMADSRDDRYLTARDFADDLRRFLDGVPTAAKPPTAVERLTKWGLRHRRLVAVTACVTLLACLGLAASTILIARARLSAQRNYQRAERNFHDAQQAVDRFGAHYAERLASVPAAAGVRREMLLDTLQYYQQFVQQAEDDPALQADLALTYSKIGSLANKIGSAEEAVEAHTTALALLEKLCAAEPHVLDHQRRRALCQNNLAMTLQKAGRTDEAQRAYREAIRWQQSLARRTHDEQLLDELAVSHMNLGLLHVDRGERGLAEQSYRAAIRLLGKRADDAPDDAERNRSLAMAFNNLSTVYADEQLDRAVDCCQSAVARQRAAVEAQLDNLEFQSELAAAYSNLGSLQSRQQQLAAAAESYEEAMEIQRRLLKQDPAQPSYRQSLAVSCNNYGLLLSRLGRAADAKQAFRQSLAIQETLVALHPDDIALRSSYGSVYNNLGIALESQGSLAEAATAFQQAVEQQRIALSRAPDVARYRIFLSKHYFNWGRVLRRHGQPDRAAQLAVARRQLWPEDGQRLLSVAEELSRAAGQLRQTPAAGELSAEQAEQLAIETLQQAARAGFRLTRDLATQEAFAPLKDNERFVQLVSH